MIGSRLHVVLRFFAFVSSGYKEMEVWHWTQDRGDKRYSECTGAVAGDPGSKIVTFLGIRGPAVKLQQRE